MASLEIEWHSEFHDNRLTYVRTVVYVQSHDLGLGGL